MIGALTLYQYDENLRKLVAYIAAFDAEDYRSFMSSFDVLEKDHVSTNGIDDAIDLTLDILAKHSLGHRTLVSFSTYPILMGPNKKPTNFSQIKLDIQKHIRLKK